MKLFVCCRTTDKDASEGVVNDLFRVSENAIAIQRETLHSENWKSIVEKKMQESDFILFVIGANTFESEQIKWEYAKAKSLNKQIIGYRLPTASEESILFCQGFQVFDNGEQCYRFLTKTYDDDRELKLEQYKIMVGSTEKVTENRMKVNNLFFTITSSILSVGFVLGKTFGFTVAATVGMIILTGLAFLVSFFWEKLVDSYGKLNTGKFKVIDKIEKQLRTNMFEDEWKILTEEVKYEPNSKTETKVIEYFRRSIIIIGVLEVLYLIYLLCPLIRGGSNGSKNDTTNAVKKVVNTDTTIFQASKYEVLEGDDSLYLMIKNLKEVRELRRKMATGNKMAIMINQRPDSAFHFFWMEVGVDHGDILQPIYNFYIRKDSQAIYFLDTVKDTLIPYHQWSDKMR